MTIAIHTDATEAGGADPADLFFNRMQDADEAIQGQDEETNENDNDEAEEPTEDDADENQPSEDEGEEDSETNEAEESSKTAVELDDNAVVKVKVDGAEQEFTLGSLKRLAGQEAALTRKQQEAADIRKHADEAGSAYFAALQHLREKAVERFKPFEGTNLLLMSKHLSAEELAIVTEQAQAARAEVDFFDSELQNHARKREHEQGVKLKADAEVAWKALSDPNTGIPNWGMNLYNDLLGYTINEIGIDKQTALTLVDPNVWKVLHDSYLYRKGQKARETKVKPVAKPSGNKTVKSSSPVTSQVAKPQNETKLMNQLRASGDIDTAADLFLARATRK
jgi:hypothetical protein